MWDIHIFLPISRVPFYTAARQFFRAMAHLTLSLLCLYMLPLSVGVVEVVI